MSSAFLNPIFVLLKVLIFRGSNLEEKGAKILTAPSSGLACFEKCSDGQHKSSARAISRLVCGCKHPLSDGSWRQKWRELFRT